MEGLKRLVEHTKEGVKELDQIEEIVTSEKCVYNTLLDCINIDKVLSIAHIGDSGEFCTLCLKAQLVRELRLLRVTS